MWREPPTKLWCVALGVVLDVLQHCGWLPLTHLFK